MFDAVRAKHEAMTAESYNDDHAHKERINQVKVCVCVCVCARAHVRAYVRACVCECVCGARGDDSRVVQQRPRPQGAHQPGQLCSDSQRDSECPLPYPITSFFLSPSLAPFPFSHLGLQTAKATPFDSGQKHRSNPLPPRAGARHQGRRRQEAGHRHPAKATPCLKHRIFTAGAAVIQRRRPPPRTSSRANGAESGVDL